MAGRFDSYKRAPGSTDAGADHGRQLAYLQSDTLKTAKSAAEQAIQDAIDARMLLQPPFGKLIKNIAAPGDNTWHPVAHGLGRAYAGAQVVGYYGSGGRVEVLTPEFVIATVTGDPTVDVYYVNQYTTPAGGAPTVDPIHFDLWVW